jgi:PAS domain S-box-containing protein
MAEASIGVGITPGLKNTQAWKRSFSFLSPVLTGLGLAIVFGILTHTVTFDPTYNQVLIFLSGAAAAALVLRLLVQRERRTALQRVVSEIVGENVSPEVAAMRILEALCLSQGWDVALKWEVNAEENRLEFCSGWSAPRRKTETLIHNSTGINLVPGNDMLGRAWQQGRPVWVADLSQEPETSHTLAAIRHGMISGCAVPIRVGSRVLGVLEFYCHFSLRENRETMTAVETVAASLGQMFARSHERGWAEKLYRQQEILLNSVADGICGLDRDGLVSFANPAAAKMLGAAGSTLPGRPVHDLLHGFAPEGQGCGQDCALLRATTRLQLMATAGEDNVFRVDGSPFRVDYALTPILDHGRLTGSVLSFRDISQRYALDRLKDEFVSTVSHELRTPLTAIRGSLGLLSHGGVIPLNEKAGNLLRIAHANTERLLRLINDILDIERMQSGRARLVFRPVQLAQIVRQAIECMEPVAEAAGVQIIHDTTQAEVAADPDRLMQVLTNLLSNAVKFSPLHSTISVLMRPDHNGVTLSVVDPGRGVPADKLESIFGRFQQVDASDSRQKGGTGLGLAICRTIVHQHSGRIWAERNPVRGLSFRVFLPYKPVPIGTAETVFEPEANGGANPPYRDPQALVEFVEG